MAARAEDLFDFKNPEYIPIFQARVDRLNWLRDGHSRPFQTPKAQERAAVLLAHYKNNIADMISDWGVTYSPHNVRSDARGHQKLPAYLPFILQPKQRELVEWILERWRNDEPGIIEKSRDVGCSWIAMATAICLCVTHRDMTIGFGSASEDKLDVRGNPDTLFFKGRMFVENLPEELRGGCSVRHNAPDKRILFPDVGSSITGEIGENIGRSGRKVIYFIDEAAFIEHPKAMESALSGNTSCRIDISSVSMDGMRNEFAIRRHSGRYKVFTLHYRDDLRRDAAWKAKKEAEFDPVVWAADFEIDYNAAAENSCIPQAWVQAAIDAHVKMNFTPTGARLGALDVADLGKDKNAFVARHGALVMFCDVWSGKDAGDIFATTERAFSLCDDHQLEGFRYDANAMGSGVRGDATRILARRAYRGQPLKYVTEFLSSNSVYQPELKVMGTDRIAKDMFQNLRAQGAWHLRMLFQQTFRAVNGLDYDKDYVISLNSRMPECQKLCIEISQPKWKTSTTGKMLVDKTPDGLASPNRFDALLMAFCPMEMPIRIADSLLNDGDDWDGDWSNE